MILACATVIACAQPTSQIHLEPVEVGVALASARIVPVWNMDADLVGMRVERLNPGEFFDQIGLREGDVIVGWNDQDFDELGDLTTMSDAIAGERPVSIQIERDSELLEISVALRPAA